jgi:hypothetical protein
MITLQLNSNQIGGLWRIEKSPNNQQLVQSINKIRNSAQLLDRGGKLGVETATQIVYKDYLDNPNLTDNQLIQIVQPGQISKITTSAENAVKIKQNYPDYATSRKLTANTFLFVLLPFFLNRAVLNCFLSSLCSREE